MIGGMAGPPFTISACGAQAHEPRWFVCGVDEETGELRPVAGEMVRSTAEIVAESFNERAAGIESWARMVGELAAVKVERDEFKAEVARLRACARDSCSGCEDCHD